jgi:Do/DeqQ family serine protease
MTARRFVFAVLLVLCGFTAGLVVLGRMRATDDAAAQTAVERGAQSTASPPPAVAAPPAAGTVALPDFTRVAERTVPAVVNVSSQQILRRRNSPSATDPFFQFFFGDPGDVFGSPGRVENSLGSGVIVSADGYILTNNHVVTGDRRVPLGDIDITVALTDKREMPAAVIGVDPDTDLALLKVDARNLPVMPWGDSRRLKVAEWVLAIGNPYQLSETVTLGIVSAVNRTDVGINQFEDFIQTDAAINPGNSGGALVNVRGELVGINTAIFSQSGGYQGIGFAVASHLARRVMNDLQEYGEVRRGTMRTMQVVPLTTQLAEGLGAPDTRGLVIWQIQRGSTAERAGLRRGDIIVGYNGAEITDGRQLLQLVADTPIGSVAAVSVLRKGQRVELKVPIEQRVARGR